MKRLLNRDIYSMMARMVAIYIEWVESVYHRSDSILITPYMIVAIAPLFSFFLTAYFSFAILYHINKRETAILVGLETGCCFWNCISVDFSV